MALIGVLITFGGFLLAVASLGWTQDVNVRMGMVLAGIAVSLFGIFGVINPAFVKKAIWRK